MRKMLSLSVVCLTLFTSLSANALVWNFSNAYFDEGKSLTFVNPNQDAVVQPLTFKGKTKPRPN